MKPEYPSKPTEIPIEAFDTHHSAIVGQTGSGKTNTGKHMVERLYALGRRVCILDPLKSDWHGITANRAGTGPGLPFAIIGGPRGAIKLPPGSGAAIGRMVASGILPHSIIDMSELERGSFSSWYVDFCKALWKHAHGNGAVHIVLEEAREFAPKERQGGEENESIYWSKRLATAGRSKGVRFIFMSQRTQQLHNDLLSSANLVVAHRTIYPADRKPVREWIAAFNGSKELERHVDATLSTLPTGVAWVCDAQHQTVQLQLIKQCETFDNSRTPAAGETSKKLPATVLDIAALQETLRESIQEANKEDPDFLRKRVEELESQLAEHQASSHEGASDHDDLEDAYARIDGLNAELQSRNSAIKAMEAELESRTAALEIVWKDRRYYAERAAAMRERFEIARAHMEEGSEHFGLVDPEPHILEDFNGVSINALERERRNADSNDHAGLRSVQRQVDPDVESIRPAKPGTNLHVHRAMEALAREGTGVPRVREKEAGSLGDAGKPTGTQQRLLDSIAWWNAAGIKQPSRCQAAFKAGYSSYSSGTFRTLLSSCRQAGLIEYVADEQLELTDAGKAAAEKHNRFTPSRKALLEQVVLPILNGPQREMLKVLCEHGPTSRKSLADRMGRESHTSGTFRTLMSSLVSLGLAGYPDKESMEPAKWLRP